MLRVSSRNARFQQWESLLSNRAKRQREREFLVQGVRPITLAAEFGWAFRALLYDAGVRSPGRGPCCASARPPGAMSPGLLADLGEKDAGPPELIAVVGMPRGPGPDPAGPGFLVVLFDRPASPATSAA